MMSRNLMAAARERGVDELTAMHGWILDYLCRNEHKDIFQKDIEAEFTIWHDIFNCTFYNCTNF